MFKKEKYLSLQVLSLLIAVSSLIASAAGIIYPGLYKQMVMDNKMPFVFGQDMISFVSAVCLLAIFFFERKKNTKLELFRIGIIGYLFYAYAPFVMGTLYNYLYFLYLEIFSLSIFYIINAFTGIEYEKLEVGIPDTLRMIIAVYSALMPFLWAPQWIIALMHYIQAPVRPGESGFAFNYYVYILDLCFVLPVCALASIYLFQKKILGLILGGIIAIKGFTLMLSVTMGFITFPIFQVNLDVGNVVLFSALSLGFLVLSLFYFLMIKVRRSI